MQELIKSWMSYQGDGTPYGESFEGFIEWAKEKYIKDNL